MASAKRKRYTTEEKLAILDHLERHLSNGGSIRTVAEHYGVAYSTLAKWRREVEPAAKPEPPADHTQVKPEISGRTLVEALKVKRDLLNEVIEDLERMLR